MIYISYKTLEEVPNELIWLHPQELLVYGKFKIQKRKNDWLLGRWTAKSLFSSNFDINLSLKQIEIRANTNRAPDIFVNNRLLQWVVSISHSHSRSLCALANQGEGIGCDIEKIEQRNPSFIRDYYTAKEKEYINHYRNQDQINFVNLLWSAKESVMKVLRLGLSIHPKKIELFESEFGNAVWNKMQMKYLKTGQKFFGQWKIEDGFVFVVMSSKEFDSLN